MTSAYQVKTTVRPGNRVEVSTPELRVGEAVEVIVLRQNETAQSGRTALDILKDIHRRKLPRTIGDADKYIQEERDSWDR